MWIQLGWLYLDTIAILQKFTDTPAEDHLYQSNVFDLVALGMFSAAAMTPSQRERLGIGPFLDDPI